MNTSRFYQTLLTGLTALLTACALFVPQTVQAQDAATKIAVLDVPGGGTDRLVEAIEQLDGLTLEDQQWFLEQIQARGFKAKGIMKRSEDLRWLMEGAKLDFILYLAPVDDTSYQGRIVGAEGTQVHTFPVDRSPDGISSAGARMIRQNLREFLAEQRPEEEPEEKSKPQVSQLDEGSDEDESNPNATRQKAASKKKASQAKLSKDWLLAMVRFNMLRRDLHIAGTNKAVLSYTSAFYPGVALSLEAYPMGSSNVEYADVGFYADYVQGFDSAPVVNEDNEEELLSIAHMEFEGGVLYLLGDPLELKDSDQAKLALAVGVRHNSLSVPDNPSLPSTSHTSLVLGTRVNKPVFTDGFEVRAGAEILPIGVFGNGEELFGETSHTYGFGADMGATYKATDDIGLVASYEFRVQRTLFTGEGEAEFVDAGGFELVQGLTGGLFYQY